MNEAFIDRRSRRMSLQMKNRSFLSAFPIRLLLAAMLALPAGGCDFTDWDSVQLQLQAQPVTGDPRRLAIHAQVTGRLSGLRYKWFAVAGECEPQESDAPQTVLKFAEGAKRDRIVAEAWRSETRVAQSQIDVTLNEERLRLAMEQLPKVQVEITNVPFYEPEGGPDTRGEIAGKVSGEVSPEHKVVIYARADAWYMQPSAYATHTIRPDNTWGTWTHTGSSYAALVVRPGFDPFLRLDVLPQVGGYVLARTIVEGKRKE